MKECILDVRSALTEVKTHKNLGTGLAELVLHISAFVLACLQLLTCSIELVGDLIFLLLHPLKVCSYVVPHALSACPTCMWGAVARREAMGT
jgi:hypothetical protein